MIEEAFKTFGKHSFQHAIFYSNQDCLRFELSEGAEFDSRISMFQTALTRTTDVLNTVFEKSDKVSICFAFAGDSFIENLSQFKEIKSLFLCYCYGPTLVIIFSKSVFMEVDFSQRRYIKLAIRAFSS
jgi:hypothetical protein